MDYCSANTYCTKVTAVKILINRSISLITENDDQQTELNGILYTLRANNDVKGFLKEIIRSERKNKLQCILTEWKTTIVNPYRGETLEEIKRILNKQYQSVFSGL